MYGIISKTWFFQILLTLLVFNGYSQVAYTKEFSLITDNDMYATIIKDRYYTNGLNLTYRKLSNKIGKRAKKKIYNFHLGHEMYTSYKPNLEDVEDQDRPFAGYLFVGFGISNFYNNNQSLKINMELGVVGESAMGYEFQNFIHEILSLPEPIGWKYQIKNTFACNLHIQYDKTLLKGELNNIDLAARVIGEVGTIFNSASIGLNSRFTLKTLQEMSNSIGYDSNLNYKNSTTNHKKEFFLFITPTMHYVYYDATIQGALWEDESPITFPIRPIYFSMELGVFTTFENMVFKYSLIGHTRKLESPNIANNNIYGSITLKYMID